MNLIRMIFSIALLSLLSINILKGQPNENAYTDHHVHLQDSATVQLGCKMLKATGQAPTKMDSIIFDADTIIERLNTAHFKKAWIISNAYWFGSPLTPVQNEYKEVKKQNDWIAEQSARYPDRLLPFMSVNPLKPYALKEIQRCAENKHFVGLKLHFANSKVDLSNKVQLARLQKVFALANKNHLLMLVHFRNGESWNATTQTKIFLNQLLPFAKNTKVVLAHMAGWGGYDKLTDAALEEISKYIKRKGACRQNLYFDLSAVLPIETDEADKPSKGKNKWNATAALSERISQIGVQYILFGTDWPLIDIGPYIEQLNVTLGSSLVEQVLKNTIIACRSN